MTASCPTIVATTTTLHSTLHQTTTWPPKRPTSMSRTSSSFQNTLTPCVSLQLVIRTPKGFRNKAPRGRTADPTGPPIRLSSPHLLSARARVYGSDVVITVVEGGCGDGDVPGPVRARADEFSAVFKGAAGEDARNARVRDRLCQDVASGECRPSEHDDDMSVSVLGLYIRLPHSDPSPHPTPRQSFRKCERHYVLIIPSPRSKRQTRICRTRPG